MAAGRRGGEGSDFAAIAAAIAMDPGTGDPDDSISSIVLEIHDRTLDLINLRSAVTRLWAGLVRHRQDTGDTRLPDGLIQVFEVTYGLAHRTLRRFLIATAASPSEFDADRIAIHPVEAGQSAC